MKNEFIKFLKSKRLWSKFKREFESSILSSKFDSVYKSIDHDIKFNKVYSMIATSFDWKKSKDGVLFWSNIDSKWEKHLKTLNK